MSKEIKQMEMDDLARTIQDVRDFVVLSVNKLSSQEDHKFRSALRGKSIRLRLVKNSLARRIFDNAGMKITGCWEQSTLLAWGSNSLAELSKEIDALIRKNEKIKAKGAISEGQEISFKQALAMPTRAEASGRIVSLALSPASRLISQILGPASLLAAQIKTVSEKSAPATETAPAPTE